jgi:hypothetical protein
MTLSKTTLGITALGTIALSIEAFIIMTHHNNDIQLYDTQQNDIQLYDTQQNDIQSKNK